MAKRFFLSVFCTVLFCNLLYAEFLCQPSKWFSIPVVGVTEITTATDGINAEYKGTIAYKNKLKFSSLEFDLSFRTANSAGKAILFQFNKTRRDSSYNDHHLHYMDKHNRSYGLLFDCNGTASFVKTDNFNSAEPLLHLNGKYDYSYPVHIRIIQQSSDDGIKFGIELNRNGKIEYIIDKLQDGFSDSGFIGLTIFNGRGTALLSAITYQGTEYKTDLACQPKPLYLTDYFEQSNRRLVHWRYDNWTTDFYKVLIKSPDGRLLDTVPYPQDYWLVDSSYRADNLLLYAVNIDGRISEPARVSLKDHHSQYYSTQSQQRITIKAAPDNAGFYLKDSGERFTVKGVNYVRLRYGDHATFEAATKSGNGYYDPYDIETTLMLLKKYGYNTVRVFVVGRNIENPGISGNYDVPGLYKPYMDNFIDFVKRANKYGIYVFPTFCDGELPRNKRYWNIIENAAPDLCLDDVTHHTHNAIYATVQGQQARVQYIEDFLNYIKSYDPSLLKTFLAVQCQNELSMHGQQWPFSITDGLFKAPDGNSYDMSDNAQRQHLFENIFSSYHNRIVSAVKSICPELLVSEGIFTPRIVGQDYNGKNFGICNFDNSSDTCPPTAFALLKSSLDFVDIHIYYVNSDASLAQSYKLDMTSTGLYAPQMQQLLRDKAFIMGEFGSFKYMAPTFASACKDILQTRDLALKDNAQGYMLWTFDTFEQRSLWHLMEDSSFLSLLNK